LCPEIFCNLARRGKSFFLPFFCARLRRTKSGGYALPRIMRVRI
jgi:hypothetical protein